MCVSLWLTLLDTGGNMAGRKASVNYYNPEFSKWNLEHGSKFSLEEKKDLLKKFKKTAQDRMYRLEKSKVGSQTAKNWKKTLNFNVNKMNESEINFKIAQLSSFLSSDQSTVSGIKKIRKKAIETLQKHGYNITEENYDEFIDFMNKFSDDFVYTSIVPNFFNKASEQGYNAKQINQAFKKWTEDKSKFKKEVIEMMKEGKTLTDEDVERIMKRGGRRGMSAEQRREMKMNRRNRNTRNKRNRRRK